MLWDLSSFSRPVGLGQRRLHHHRVHRGGDNGVRLVEGLPVSGRPAVLWGHLIPSGVVSARGGRLYTCMCVASARGGRSCACVCVLSACRGEFVCACVVSARGGRWHICACACHELICQPGQLSQPIPHGSKSLRASV